MGTRMHRSPAFLVSRLALLLVAAGCGGASDGEDSPTDGQPPDSGDTHTGDTDSADTHTGDTDSADTDTGPPSELLTGVVECPPPDGYDPLPVEGIQTRRYCLGPEHVSGYRDNDGNDPAFSVVWPETWQDPSAAHPVLVYLHGGVVGVDGEDFYGGLCSYFPDPKTGALSGVYPIAHTALVEKDVIHELARRNDWLVVLPESNWCDLWGGLGALDPVDTGHESLHHVETVLDVLSAGLNGFRIDEDRIFAWGASIGGLGAWVVAAGYPEDAHRIAAIVTDSGPFDVTGWYSYYADHFEERGFSYLDYRPPLDHILGGAPFEEDGVTPSAFYANYGRYDVDLMLRAGTVDVPAFVAYNSYDRLAEPIHGQEIAVSLPEVYAETGQRGFVQDLAHHAPSGEGQSFHTQLGNFGMPWAYYSTAAVDFLLGGDVSYTEAEALCSDGACRFVDEMESPWCEDPTDVEACYASSNIPAKMNGGTAAYRGVDDGDGIVFRGPLPADLPRHAPLALRAVLYIDGMDATPASAEVVSLELTVDGVPFATRSVTMSEVAPPQYEATGGDLVDQVEATTLDGDFDGDGVSEGLPDGEVVLTIRTTAVADVYFDGIFAVVE